MLGSGFFFIWVVFYYNLGLIWVVCVNSGIVWNDVNEGCLGYMIKIFR